MHRQTLGALSLAALVALAPLALGLVPDRAQAQAGLLTGVTDLEPLTLSVMEPMASEPYELEAGRYYRLEIVCDGSGELAIAGPDFFRNVWVNEVVIEDIEVRPLGIDSLEFDSAGTATLSFVTIRPGSFELRIPGTTGESQRAVFNVR